MPGHVLGAAHVLGAPPTFTSPPCVGSLLVMEPVNVCVPEHTVAVAEAAPVVLVPVGATAVLVELATTVVVAVPVPQAEGT